MNPKQVGELYIIHYGYSSRRPLPLIRLFPEHSSSKRFVNELENDLSWPINLDGEDISVPDPSTSIFQVQLDEEWLSVGRPWERSASEAWAIVFDSSPALTMRPLVRCCGVILLRSDLKSHSTVLKIELNISLYPRFNHGDAECILDIKP